MAPKFKNSRMKAPTSAMKTTRIVGEKPNAKEVNKKSETKKLEMQKALDSKPQLAKCFFSRDTHASGLLELRAFTHGCAQVSKLCGTLGQLTFQKHGALLDVSCQLFKDAIYFFLGSDKMLQGGGTDFRHMSLVLFARDDGLRANEEQGHCARRRKIY